MASRHVIDIKLQDRHVNCIAQGCLTNSKHTDRFVKGVYPNVIVDANGCHVRSSLNKEYVDYICGLGSCLLGYNNKGVKNAIINELGKGLSFSLPSKTEIEAGERIKEIFPIMEKVKFLKTGSEACMAAIRMARAYTNRTMVLARGYHGWSDEFVSLTPPAAGCTSHPFMAPLHEIDQINKDVAAVIVEPVELDDSMERIMWLNRLKKRCNEMGTVLIFDEIITGFRYKGWSVASHYNIRPDILLLGKAIANGLPLSVVGGRADIMDNDQYFVSSTFAGENISLAAMIKVIDQIAFGKFKISELWDAGQTFLQKVNAVIPEKIYIDGYPVRGVFRGDEHFRAVFWQECIKAGILFGPSWFFMFPHIEHNYRMIDIITDLLHRINAKLPALQGAMPTSPFSAGQRK